MAIDEAQKTFVVRKMRPKELNREFLTGPRMFDEIMEKLEVVMNEMMANEGQVPMDLGDTGAHDAKMTQGDQEADNKMSYDDMCAIAWKGYKAGKGSGKKGIDGTGTWNRGKGYDGWQVSKGDDGSRKGGEKGSKGSSVCRKYDGHSGRRRHRKARRRAILTTDTDMTAVSKDTSV